MKLEQTVCYASDTQATSNVIYPFNWVVPCAVPSTWTNLLSVKYQHLCKTHKVLVQTPQFLLLPKQYQWHFHQMLSHEIQNDSFKNIKKMSGPIASTWRLFIVLYCMRHSSAVCVHCLQWGSVLEAILTSVTFYN